MSISRHLDSSLHDEINIPVFCIRVMSFHVVSFEEGACYR